MNSKTSQPAVVVHDSPPQIGGQAALLVNAGREAPTRDPRASEERFRGIFRNVATVAVQGYAMDGTVRYWNRASETIYGYTADEAIGRNLLDLIIPPAMRDEVRTAIRRMAETGETIPASELALMRKDGSLVLIYSSHALVQVPGQDLELFCIDIDITDRKRAETQLRLQSLVLNQIQDCVTITDLNGIITYVNEAEVRVLGYSRDELIGAATAKYGEHSERGATQRQILEETLKHGAWRGVVVNRTAEGKELILDCRTQTILDDQGHKVALAGISTDITEREKLQAQLAQAQKMESIGRLAGGVAHDFNNMLQSVLGFTESALARVEPGDHLLRADLDEVLNVARRSANLTRQLLAFARKQTVAPQVLDLNEAVTDMLKMLRRLIGEDIVLVWKPGSGLWPVRMDPAQVDAILANLCVNARDAIAGTGKVTIETGTAVFDEDDCARHAGSVPGDYVLLAVSDDGCGMDAEALAHLFEPFFTTKEPGKGTGLGLSSVHGAVAQNGGSIEVASAPGRGTTFRIYLPRHAEREVQVKRESKPREAARGSGTILLVEDEPGILKTTGRMLQSLGYTVMAAATPDVAIRLAREQAGRIDLLITDVVMPEMNGWDLANALLAMHPDIRRLFISGYTADVIAPQGVLDQDIHYIQKPFSKTELAEKLREALK